MRAGALQFCLLVLVGCSEYTVRDSPPPPPADPPEEEGDPFGNSPDWASCTAGFDGIYFNLKDTHQDIEPEDDETPQKTPEFLDWWSGEPAFSSFDASLDHGTNWWPVDQGLSSDPAYFSTIWYAWIRVWDDATVGFTIASSDDLWISINSELVVSRPGVQDFVPETVEVQLEAGQYPIEIRYAHRSGDSGMRFRVLGDTATICYPDYSVEE